MYRLFRFAFLMLLIAGTFTCSCAAGRPSLDTCKLLRPETQDKVHLYAEADFAARIKAAIDFSSAVRLKRLALSATEEWVKVQHGREEGWVHASYLDCRPAPALAEAIIAETSRQVLLAIRRNDWAAVDTYAHPVKGVRFSPYGVIDYQEQQVIAAGQLAAAQQNPSKRVWGFEPGSGDPISLSFSDYAKRFVTGHDYGAGEAVAYNQPTGLAHLDQSLVEIYPHAITVAHKVTGLDAAVHGTTWSSLLLIFEPHGDRWHLVGIAHASWTV